MKLSMPVKLGIAVVLLFAVVIAICLLWTPLKIRYYMRQVRSEKGERLKTAVSKLAALGNRGLQALSNEAVKGKEEIEFLLNHMDYIHKPVPNTFRNALQLAAWDGYPYAARKLIDMGAEVDWRDSGGGTSLHIAAWCGNKNVAVVLIDRGANISATKENGWTPLHNTLREGWHRHRHERIDGLPSNFKMNIIPIDKTRKGRVEIARLLLANGADVNAQAKHGVTPMDLLNKSTEGDEFRPILDSYNGKTSHQIHKEARKKK